MVVTIRSTRLRALGTDRFESWSSTRAGGFFMAPILTVIADTVGILGGW
jgi:ABC-type transporter Mla maintaining outer membrane lipid asymmetry permease subunit MlaE